jgi:predicted Zn finger-like uncharacterized protein
MPLVTVCPGCQTRYNLPDTAKGKQVRCKKCGNAFLASPSPASDTNISASPNSPVVSRPGPNQRPVPAKAEAPAAARASGGAGIVIALIGIAAVLLLACGGGGAWFFIWGPGTDLFGKKEPTEKDLEAAFNDMAKQMDQQGFSTMPRVDKGKVEMPDLSKIDPSKLPNIDPKKLPDVSKIIPPDTGKKPDDVKVQPKVDEKPVVKVEPPPPEAKRKPVPKDTELAAADKLVKDVFKDEYAKTGAADKVALAQKLVEQAKETKDDMAARYVLFRESIDLATQAGDLDQAFRSADELGKDFDLSSASLKADVIDKAATSVAAGEPAKALVDTLLPIINEAVAADDYEAAARITKAAEAAAKKAKTLALLSQVQNRAKDLDNLKASFEKVKAALTTLKTKPDDAEANLLVGRHYCLAKGDWAKGLPYLAKGSDAALKTLAEKDAATPDKPAEQTELADAWYDLANSKDLEPAYKGQVQLRALHWYEQAIVGLTGLNKAKVDKRITELDKVAAKYRTYGELFATARDGIKNNQTKNTATPAGAFSRKPFRDVPKEGWILIGFEVGLGKFFDSDIIDYLRPIWLTPGGEKLGEAYGKPPANVTILKAKPGYAVGGIVARGGGGLDGFSVTFMRIDKKSLKKGDAYTSAWFGCKGEAKPGPGEMLGGDGSLVVGLQGRIHEPEGKIGAFGLVLVPPGK